MLSEYIASPPQPPPVQPFTEDPLTKSDSSQNTDFLRFLENDDDLSKGSNHLSRSESPDSVVTTGFARYENRLQKKSGVATKSVKTQTQVIYAGEKLSSTFSKCSIKWLFLIF